MLPTEHNQEGLPTTTARCIDLYIKQDEAKHLADALFVVADESVRKLAGMS